jgi:hypothetical protein
MGIALCACADDRRGRDSGVQEDASSMRADAFVDDRDASRDAAIADVGTDGGPLDPSICPVGPADGCCPLLVHGGRDPDCPSMACDTLTRGEPILLEGDEGRSWQGAAPMAWTGNELVIVRGDDNATEGRSFVIERRNYEGIVTYGPHRTEGADRGQPGNGALAFDPISRRLLYSDPAVYLYRVVAFDLDGAVQWTDSAFEICNTWDSVIDIHAADGRFYVTGENYTCAGSTGQPVIFDWASDGTAGRRRFLGEGATAMASWESSAACDLGCEHIASLWSDGQTAARVRVFDREGDTLSPGENVETWPSAYIDHSGMASDGETFFLYYAVGTDAAGNTSRRFRRWRADEGWVDDGVLLAGTRGLPASAVWTGDGWIVVTSSFFYTTSYAFPTDRTTYRVHVWHFAADGTLREDFDNDAQPGLFARLVWAGGRVALTWVRVGDAGEPERHYLRYLGCD